MRQATPQLRDLARQVFGHEAEKSRDPRDAAGVMENVCQQLHGRLDPLIGGGGFHALLARALHLAGREFAWLDVINVEDVSGCSLRGLAEAAQGRDAAEAKKGFVAVLANIVWLLVTFIGEDIVLSLLRERWPEISTGAASSGSEKKKR